MMRRLGRLACALLLAQIPAAATAQEDPLAEVRACVQKNLPTQSSVQQIEMQTIDRTGAERTLHAKIYWKRYKGERPRMLMRVFAPPDVRGSSYLVIEKEKNEEMFVYLPEYRRVRQIHPATAAGSVFGTDISYEDVGLLRKVSQDLEGKRLPDATHAERPVYVVEISSRQLPPDSIYDRALARVDRESCVPLRIELFDKGGRVIKEIEADPTSLTREGEIWVANAFAIRDLVEGTETRVKLEDLEIDVDVPDRLFTVSNLEKGH